MSKLVQCETTLVRPPETIERIIEEKEDEKIITHLKEIETQGSVPEILTNHYLRVSCFLRVS